MEVISSSLKPTKYRIESIDLLKGLVMVIMALDHVRDYFHASAYNFDPADPLKTNLGLFFTRWITHFCAPAFSFLAGLSAFMVGRKKTKKALSFFLIKRGLWLIFIELSVVGFAWYFDVQFRTFGLLVIWALGISMIVLSGLIHLPKNAILIFSCVLIFGHNLLDNIHPAGCFIWTVLHEQKFVTLSAHTKLFVGYPIIPWIAVMGLGYYFGNYYTGTFSLVKRRQFFNLMGATAIVLFIVLRWTNVYGDPQPYKDYGDISKNIVSFLNPTKYPPSLQYLLMTLGGTFLFLANSEQWRGKVVDFFCTFGRVPFFFYIIHLYVIHSLAMIFARLSGFGWGKLMCSTWITLDPKIKGYGYSIWVVYVVWAGIILLLYPICRKFDRYKQSHKEKKWLSYL